MKHQQFLEILDRKAVQPDDLDIIEQASFQTPGLARLKAATIGQTDPQAPNSAPLVSRTGARIGFVAAADLIEGPYDATYWIEANGSQAQ